MSANLPQGREVSNIHPIGDCHKSVMAYPQPAATSPVTQFPKGKFPRDPGYGKKKFSIQAHAFSSFLYRFDADFP